MSEEIQAPVPEKRGPGRPRKVLSAKPEGPPPVHNKFKMKAKPNWDLFDASADDTPDRLRIPSEKIPEGMSLQWVTDTCLGQAMAQHRQLFERMGWTPVHQEDFDGVYNGMFMPMNAPGEINVEGLVLMARPKELTDKAKRSDYKKARDQLEIKERALRGGDIPGVTLDAKASNALQGNKINRSFERISVPED
jgi:hypothetical protein